MRSSWGDWAADAFLSAVFVFAIGATSFRLGAGCTPSPTAPSLDASAAPACENLRRLGCGDVGPGCEKAVEATAHASVGQLSCASKAASKAEARACLPGYLECP